jgi:hypothetical protein
MFHRAIHAGLRGAQVRSSALFLLPIFGVSAPGHGLVSRTPAICKL